MAASPSPFFNKIIQLALIELGIKDGKGLGTIHIYNAEEHMLDLKGDYGPIKYLEKAKRHSVRLGHGIVSWVVLRRRAILIRDLTKSPFKRIHVPINDDVKSELAVPLEANGELIGVMCLECTDKNAFEPGHVRLLWHAARRAALIYQLHQQVSMNKQLLELCVSTGLAANTHAPLNKVAELAQQYLKASYCDIWRYNSDGDYFEKWGANYKIDAPPVRKRGWTEYVQHSKNPIWITKIKNKLQYSVFHWIDNKWIDNPSIDECPKELNEKLLAKNPIGELGIPITMFGNPVGVAWIKYTRERLDYPKPGLMELALAFAATAGLVLDSIQRHEIDLIRKKRVDIVAEGIASGIRSRWKQFSSGNLDIHVESRPFHSYLGGDFYAGKIIDENTFGILLLDGEGHGIEGSLHMLPLMAAFEGFDTSYSTTDVIHKMITASDRLGVHATAVYCIFSQIGGNQWLAATCAGHPSLIHIRRQSGGGYSMDAFPKMNFAPLGYAKIIKEPLKEENLLLNSGDFIVAFTDGIASEEENEFSVAVLQGRIMKVLGLYRDKTTARNIVTAIMREVINRDKKDRLTDDATVLVVKVM
ncbi:MAG: GAF domain-containing protein [Acidobacteria bacterium]|nr:GAF domain-containing protein [Acidobacteriota bacterium]